MLFLYKQKTAYGMRISDWSSDVCSSDLTGVQVTVDVGGSGGAAGGGGAVTVQANNASISTAGIKSAGLIVQSIGGGGGTGGNAVGTSLGALFDVRSAERRVGTECGSTCRSRWSR